MTDWITDRPPTVADADREGEVCVRQNPSSEQNYRYLHWSYVGPGVPWRPSAHWRPPSEPAPEPPAAELAHDPVLFGWITDRQPSAEDADRDGDVLILLHANGSGVSRDDYVNWRHVGPGAPWRHSNIYVPPATATEPQPAPEPVATDRPALAVGQTWRKRDGQIATIVRNDGTDEWPFETSDGNWYAPNGYLYSAFHIDKRDLIELISEAPEPAPVSPARRFVSISRTINVLDRPTLDAIDDEGIAWVLHPGATEWERLIALPDREAPAQ